MVIIRTSIVVHETVLVHSGTSVVTIEQSCTSWKRHKQSTYFEEGIQPLGIYA